MFHWYFSFSIQPFFYTFFFFFLNDIPFSANVNSKIVKIVSFMQFLHNKEKARGLGIVFLQRKSNRSAGTGSVVAIVETVTFRIAEGVKLHFGSIAKVGFTEELADDGAGEAAADQKTERLLALFTRILLV